MPKTKSTKFSVNYRGGKTPVWNAQSNRPVLQEVQGRSLYLGDDPADALAQWIEKIDEVDAEETGTVEINTESLDVGGL